MNRRTFNEREAAIQEVAAHFTTNYDAMKWLNSPLESNGKAPKDLIFDNDFDSFYDGLDKLED